MRTDVRIDKGRKLCYTTRGENGEGTKSGDLVLPSKTMMLTYNKFLTQLNSDLSEVQRIMEDNLWHHDDPETEISGAYALMADVLHMLSERREWYDHRTKAHPIPTPGLAQEGGGLV